MSFGKEIKRIRDASGVSASRLADLIGIPADRLRKWESKDFDPRLEDRQKIEHFFKMEMDNILELERIPKTLLLHSGPANEKYFEDGPGKLVTKLVNAIHEQEIQLNPLLKKARGTGSENVKYYDQDFAAGKSVAFYEDNVEAPAYEMNIPAFSGCIAFNVFGDSMEKIIRSGSIVFGRKVDDWSSFLEFGQIYGIVMKDERRFLKYIRKSENPKNFLLKSENEHYDDFEIPSSKIHNLWLIEGWMLKRT